MSTFTRWPHLQLPSPHHIRLLEFPAYTDQEEPLQGTIRVVDIEESTIPYMALSYTWGQPNFSEDLLLDGKGILRITPNLAAALRHFRYSSALRWIWVDAICINQQDDAEKTMQIPLMGDIYRGASRVLVWLGDRAQDVDSLRQIKRLIGRITDTHEDDDTAHKLVISMFQLCRLPWFSRRWVIQELVLNPNAVLCCGQIELPWIHLAPAFHVIDLKKWAGFQSIRLLWDLWRDVSLPMGTRNKDTGHKVLGNRDIAALMNSCSEFECSDGHDRIAALSALSTDVHRSVTVNYADSVESTFINFAEGLARSGHMAWLIYQSAQRKKNSSTQGNTLPSWVPDWRAAVSTHDQNSKLDTEVYNRVPCDIQMYSASPSLHVLTANFSIFVDKDAAMADSSQVPANVDPAPLRVAWKSALFPKEADTAERMALVLVGLWPWVLARLSKKQKAFKKLLWSELLLWLFFFLGHPPKPDSFCRRFNKNMARLRAIPDFSQDANGLDTLRSFTRNWVSSYLHDAPVFRERSKEDLARIDCLIFCRHTSEFGIFTPRTPFALGSLQVPFYRAVVIGDKVLSADLGQFHFPHNNHSSAEPVTRHIVRKQASGDSLPVLFGANSPDKLRAANESVSVEAGSKIPRGNSPQEVVLPVAYEFVAPCDLISLLPWSGGDCGETWMPDSVTEEASAHYGYSPIKIVSKSLSICIE